MLVHAGMWLSTVLGLASPRAPAVVLAGTVLDVAASDTAIAAVRERDVVLLAPDGHLLARRTRSGESQVLASERDETGAAVPRDGVLGTRAGLLALVAGVAIREDRRQLVAIDGLRGRRIDLLQASPDGGRVIAVTGRKLLVSSDGGAAFSPGFDLPRPPRAVVVSPAGAIFVADALGAWQVDSGRTNPVLAGPVSTLAWCDEALVALTAGAVAVVHPDRAAVRISPAPSSAALRCSAAPGGTWLLIGPGLWSSVDGGRSWQGRAEAPAPVLSAAERDGELWVASGAGLLRLGDGGGDQAPGFGAAGPMLPGTGAPSSGAPPAWRAPFWPSLLPAVQLDVAVAEAGNDSDRSRRAFEVRLALVFRPGRHLPTATMTALSRERLRQRALLELAPQRSPAGDSEGWAVRSAVAQLLGELP